MAIKTFNYRGRSLEELQKMSLEEFSKLLPARERRKIKRGLTEVEKKFLEDIKSGSKNIKTQARDMLIVPQMVGKATYADFSAAWEKGIHFLD